MTIPTRKDPRCALHLRDVRGLASLAMQATLGVTRITEGVHQAVWDTLGIRGGSEPGRTGGITGTAYKSVYAITYALGKGASSALGQWLSSLESTDEVAHTTPQREAVLAALNGVIGDRLVAGHNPLATPMSFRYRGAVLDGLNRRSMPEATAKVVLLIHGLCRNEAHWQTQEDAGQDVSHGDILASELGYTPLYLRYNSGLHISQNGRALAAQLEHLIDHFPVAIDELTIVAHSMGGLLSRSAFHYAEQMGLRWPSHLKHIVFLGTPHHGAPLERAGNWVDVLLETTPFTAPFARLAQLRSAGITDLRYGNLVDEDWQDHDRFDHHADHRHVVPLPESVACHTIAATTAPGPTRKNSLVGDGLVPVQSALGHHQNTQRNLAFPEASQWIAYGTNHMDLLRNPNVARKMVEWLT